MKALAGVFGVVAPIVTIAATLVRLKWHHAKEAPGPTDQRAAGGKALRVAAAVWLIAVATVAVLLVLLLVLPDFIRLFV